MPKFRVEVRWNNAAVKSICPITGEQHKPWIGLYPFLAGTWRPVDYYAIEESDPAMANQINAISVAAGQNEPDESVHAFDVTIGAHLVQASAIDLALPEA